MKFWNFLIFISIVVLVYGSVNYYIFIRGLQAIPKDSSFRSYYIILFIIIALCFWAGRISENFISNGFTDTLVWIGSFWLAFILYFFLFIVVLDLVRLGNHFFNFYPDFITNNYEKVKFITGTAVTTIVVIIVIAGHINFLNPRIHKFEINIPKQKSQLDKLNIAVAADLHLGTIVGKSRLDDFVKKINSLNADIVLLPGDIFDEDIGPIIKKNLGDDLIKLRAKYGVYGVTGNHEYIGGAAEAVKYLEEHGIKMIRDSAVLIDSSFYVAGREDKSMSQFSNNTRKELSEIINKLDKDYPIILLDHQPFNLHLARENGVDLQLSGHTHHGQLWPLNYITGMVYELSWGYKKKGSTHYYVTSGFAGWGPPVRTGSDTEVVNIIVNFQ